MKFKSVLRTLILEASRYAVLRDNLTKPSKDKKGDRQKPKLTVQEYVQLAQADPTLDFRNIDPYTEDPDELDRIRGGNYLNWLIKNYLNPTTERSPEDAGYEREVAQAKSVFLEDLGQITYDLRKFDKFKNRFSVDQRDIMKLTHQQVYDLVKDLSLEKTKATQAEKEQAATSYEHPGGEIIFRGKDWTVVKISDTGNLGKDAACFYGGYYLTPEKGESRWCTSSPGLDFFNRYIQQGPLYVIIPNQSSGKIGEKSKLPADRYQFHFPTDQFKDVHNGKNIDIAEMLNGPMKELSELFKIEFAKGVVSNNGTEFDFENFLKNDLGKYYISIYGFDDVVWNNIPDTIQKFSISIPENKQLNIKLPENMGRFKNLHSIFLNNCISEIPDSVCDLKKLTFLTLVNNPNLKSIPACLANLALPKGNGNLMFINTRGSNNVKVPREILEVSEFMGSGIYDLSGEDQ